MTIEGIDDNRMPITRRTIGWTCVLEMSRRQVGETPAWVAVSHELSIECCSVSGNRHVEAQWMILRAEKAARSKGID